MVHTFGTGVFGARGRISAINCQFSATPPYE